MANLPADLPENWTQGQIISPNGKEVGLSEKYGYNYLMKQVNATQKAINDIGTSAAQESTLKGVVEKIGNTDDTGATDSTGTMMAKLNAVIGDRSTIPVIKDIVISNLGIYSSNANTTLAEVTGECELMSLLLYSEKDSTINCTLEIDDSVYKLSINSYAFSTYQWNGVLIPLPKHCYNFYINTQKADSENSVAYLVNSTEPAAYVRQGTGIKLVKNGQLTTIKTMTSKQKPQVLSLNGRLRAAKKIKISSNEYAGDWSINIAIAKL